MIEYVRLMRPKHYLKNMLVFVPAFFDLRLFEREVLVRVTAGFLTFSLLSSVIYIVNDIRDASFDLKNERKRHRPVASGAISRRNAWIFAIILLFCVIGCLSGMGGGRKIPWTCFRWLLLYLVLNLAYSFKLKNVPIADILILAFGYVIRIMYGGELVGSTISYWLYMTVLVGALYMAFGKRRNEFIQEPDEHGAYRNVLRFYNRGFLEKSMYMFLGMAIMFYALWCGDEQTIQRIGNRGQVWTVVIVIALAMRYALDIESDDCADPIEIILKDKGMIWLGVLYVVCMFGMLYLF